MAIDLSRFHPSNVTDTCAIWNILSSQLLLIVSLTSGCNFCCTQFVNYECLHKARKNRTPRDEELQKRLLVAQEQGAFKAYHLDIDDLQEVTILRNRMKLSKGELSSIAFAKKTALALLTDDQKARKLAKGFLKYDMVQTTPHLFGWLYFNSKLSDGDKGQVIAEHESFGRPLTPFFEEMYLEALRCRLMMHSQNQE